MSRFQYIESITAATHEKVFAWFVHHYFVYVPENTPNNFDEFIEAFRAGDLPDTVLNKPYAGHTHEEVSEWMERTYSGMFGLAIELQIPKMPMI